MNWEILTPFLEKSSKEVLHIEKLDERLAMLIFNVADLVETAERKRFAQEYIDLVGFYCGPVDLEAAIRARSQK